MRSGRGQAQRSSQPDRRWSQLTARPRLRHMSTGPLGYAPEPCLPGSVRCWSAPSAWMLVPRGLRSFARTWEGYRCSRQSSPWVTYRSSSSAPSWVRWPSRSSSAVAAPARSRASPTAWRRPRTQGPRRARCTTRTRSWTTRSVASRRASPRSRRWPRPTRSRAYSTARPACRCWPSRSSARTGTDARSPSPSSTSTTSSASTTPTGTRSATMSCVTLPGCSCPAFAPSIPSAATAARSSCS